MAGVIHPLTKGEAYSGDLNELIKTGIYDIVIGATNAPEGLSTLNASSVLVINHEDSNVKQLFLGRDNQIFYRTKKSGIWNSWSKIL